MALEKIYELSDQRRADVEYTISLSMVEVFNEQVRDLLHSTPGDSILYV